MRIHAARSVTIICVLVLPALGLTASERGISQENTATAATSAKIWLDRQQQIEEYVKSAEIVRIEDIGVGVTKPKKAYLAAGGPVDAIAWKSIPPGRYNGYWESYKSEIAAYEMDKLLGLNMIPPTVERRVKGDLGAAIMWASPTKSFKQLGGAPTPPPIATASWNRQIIRAKMFDNLIHNTDPNLGNWLVDPMWNLILIDHTRSFTTGKDMVHEMSRIDRELWDRMKTLTEETLTSALGPWVVGKSEIRSILERRDKMQTLIDKLVAGKGEAATFVP
jgi:hypothetical protein